MNLANRIASSAGASFSSTVLAMGTAIVIARTLGPTGKGLYSLATLIPLIAVSLGNFGLDSGFTFSVARTPQRAAELKRQCWRLFLLLGGGITLATNATIWFGGGRLLPHSDTNLHLLANLAIPFLVLSSLLQGILVGQGKIARAHWIVAANSAVTFLAVLTISFATTSRVAPFLVAFVLISIGRSVLLLRNVQPTTVERTIDEAPHSLTRFSLICHAANVCHWLHLRSNFFLLNFFLGPLAVGLYSVSQSLCESLWTLPRVASSALMPAVASQRKESGLAQTLRASRTTIFITAIGALGLGLVAAPAIRIAFGTEFAGSVVPLWLLLPGVCIGASTGILSSFLTGRGRPEFAFYNSSASLVLNIVLNLILIPRQGIAGAAIASTLSYSFSALLNYMFLRQMSDVAVRKVVLIRREEIWRILRIPLAAWDGGERKVS